MFRWGLFILGWAIIDVCSWNVGLPRYLGVQVGGLVLYVSGCLLVNEV